MPIPADEQDSGIKISFVMDNSMYLELNKTCAMCSETLREEEILSGMLKNQSEYIIKCPICKQCFVPKFKVFTE